MSAYSLPPTLAPASREIACSSFSGMAASGKIASTPSERMTGAMGKLQASASAGRLIGPALGGVLAGFVAFRSIFLIVGAMISVAALAIILFLREPPRPAVRRDTPGPTGFLSVLADHRIRLGLLGLLVTMAAVSLVMPVFPLFVEDLEIDSLMAMEILIAIEKRFDIEVEEEKLLEFRTLRQVMAVVDEYLE